MLLECTRRPLTTVYHYSKTSYVDVKGTSVYSQGTDDASYRFHKTENSNVPRQYEFSLLCVTPRCLRHNRHESQSAITNTYPSIILTEWLLSRICRTDNVFYVQC